MKVIIPAAGLGTRLRPHTYSKPKPLVNVAGKPVLGHIMDKLVQLHPDELIFITGYLGDQIEDYVRKYYDVPSRFVEQKERRGQSHAIWLAREAIDQPVLIVFVDTIFEADLSDLDTLQSDGIITVAEVDDPSRFGVVKIENGYVTRLVEKPKEYISNLAVVGVYYLRDWQMLLRAIEDQMTNDQPLKGEYFIADALQKMINWGARLEARPVSVWEDCGQRDAILKCNRYLLSKQPLQEYSVSNSTVVPPVNIAPSARVINSVVGPYVTIGENARVEGCVLEDCIINEGAMLRHVVLKDSLVGSNATVREAPQRLDVGDCSEVLFE